MYILFVIAVVFVIISLVSFCLKYFYFKSVTEPKLGIGKYIYIVIVFLILTMALAFLVGSLGILEDENGVLYNIFMVACYIIPVAVSFIVINKQYSKIKKDNNNQSFTIETTNN